MTAAFDIAILGAGPAGMAAAARATHLGASVVVLDEQPNPGGQIYRNVDQASAAQHRILGPDYSHGRDLTQALRSSGAVHCAGATVWDVSRDGRVTYSKGGQPEQIHGRHLILATGAIERPMPLPGWTLPGVMTAGAAQILLKSGGLVARDPVLIGCGPLLYLLAAQMIAAGRKPRAMIETQSLSDMWAARGDLPGALRGWRYLAKGVGLLAKIMAAGVPRYSAARDIALVGKDALQSVQFKSRDTSYEITTDTALLHHGVVPNTQISRALRLDHAYDQTQRCFVPKVDALCTSSEPNISIAGDGAGIGGAKVAALSGEIAAFGAACQLGLIPLQAQQAGVAPLMRKRRHELHARPFLDRSYPPAAQSLSPADATLICRCEEVTAGDIRRFAKLGCKGPNQAKAFGRAGMGPCQGRFCGLTVTELLAQETGQSQDDTGALRIRAPLKPVTLGELAAYDANSQET
ncbi:FAD-dependent oxidoreductase [Shimia sp. R11_0]|uniref:FAD/NAD(P)-dependent oxidoreductase n=1 Tax=Shimia sp. R11_0 TaxID=2821096 RepID=UPI001ADCFDD8|nr:NAD(P)/FAD-dependent oxidoreductase [Shimia sp. R11_0]MBO9479642.1 FAD-dependent oxidoreductase [Shimia sp. R11_0]